MEPFAKNYVEGETEEESQDEILCLNSEEPIAYMTKEEYDDLIAQTWADEDLVAQSVENPDLVARRFEANQRRVEYENVVLDL